METSNYDITGIHRLILCWDNGRGNGNYYLGFRVYGGDTWSLDYIALLLGQKPCF